MSNWKPAAIAAIVVGVIGVVAGILIGGDDGETTTVAQPADTTATTTPTDETTTSSEEATTPPTETTTPTEETTTSSDEATTPPTETTTPTEEASTFLFDERRTGRVTFGKNLTEPVFRAVTIDGQSYERGIEATVQTEGVGAGEQFIAVPLEPGDERFITAFGVERNPFTKVNIEARADDPLGEPLGEKVLVDGSEAPAGTLDVDIPPDVETLYIVIRKQITKDRSSLSASPVVLGDPRLTAE